MCNHSISLISTLEDPKVDLYRSVRDADLRGRRHLCMIESELVVRRLLASDWNIHSLFLSPQKYERLSSFIPKSTTVYVADVTLMSQITGFHIHRGTLALVHRPACESLSIDKFKQKMKGKKTVSLLIAENITNVDNMGALFRNAAGFGVDGIVLDHACCDPLYRKSIRVSMGHTLSIPYAVCSRGIADLRSLKKDLRIKLIGCETGCSAQPIWKVNPTDRFGLIMGEEKSGLSPQAIQECDVIAEIPMSPAVPSLNVAVASAVGLYEFLGRNSFNDG